MTRDPKNPVWQGDLATAHGMAGDLLLACNEVDAALKEFGAAASCWEDLAAADASIEHRRAVAEMKDRTGQALEVKKQPAAAIPFYQQALSIVDQLLPDNPADQLLEQLRAVVCFHLGRAMTHCRPVDQRAARAILLESRGMLINLKSADGTFHGKEQAEMLADVERSLAELDK